MSKVKTRSLVSFFSINDRLVSQKVQNEHKKPCFFNNFFLFFFCWKLARSASSKCQLSWINWLIFCFEIIFHDYEDHITLLQFQQQVAQSLQHSSIWIQAPRQSKPRNWPGQLVHKFGTQNPRLGSPPHFKTGKPAEPGLHHLPRAPTISTHRDTRPGARDLPQKLGSKNKKTAGGRCSIPPGSGTKIIFFSRPHLVLPMHFLAVFFLTEV